MHRWLVVVALFTVACAYHAPDAPTPIAAVTTNVPATLNLGSVAGASAGATTLTAKVQNGSGVALSGVMVQFGTNVGTLSADAVMTTATGQAVSTLTSAAGSTSAITATVGTLSSHLLVTTPAAVPPLATPPPPVPPPDPTTPPAPLTVTLLVTTRAAGATDFALATSAIRSATWTFGDNTPPVTTTDPFTSHTYAAAATYTAGVTVTDLMGRTASTGASVAATAPPGAPVVVAPTPSYTVTLSGLPSTVVVGSQVTLTAIATAINGAPTPSLYSWDCDNNATPEKTSPTPSETCTYLTAGNVTAKVTVTGGSATGSGTTTTTVTAMPVPSYSVTLSASPTTVVAGGTSTLTAMATAVNGAPTPTLYAWDCDNNGSVDASTSTPSTICPYPAAGSTTGKVTVTGGTATGFATTTVTVTAAVLPLFTNTGTGNTVFTMPTSVSRIHIVGSYPGMTSNFVVTIGGQLVVNEVIGSAQTPMVSDGIYLTTGGVVAITLSSGVAWTFTEVR